MYMVGVNPITSAKWDGSQVPAGKETPNDSGRNSSEAERGQSVERTPTRTVEE